jgi:phage-related protein
MSTIGPGVRELRVHTAKFAEAIYVLHAFEKRTKKTSQRDLDLARQRYQAIIAQR